MSASSDSLVLGGGCFWCVEAAYKLLPGVVHVTSGYAGGNRPNPTYEQVCSHATGHVEVIKIDFDPHQVSLDQLFDYFWHVHDPTVKVGGQGGDHGPQYASSLALYYEGEAQRAAAEKSRAAAQKEFTRPITTEIAPLKKFWPAEDYHQDYFAKHPDQGYCAVVIRPKVDKLKRSLGAET